MLDDILVELPTVGLETRHLAETIRSLIEYLRQTEATTIYRDQTTGVPIILVGYQLHGWGADKNVGIKISRPGQDVRTAPLDDLELSYSLANLKINGNLTVTGQINAT